MNMSEIRCQLWEFAFDIETRSVPMDQRASGKSVPHIVETWAAPMALRQGAESELLGYPREGVARHAIRDSDAALGNEKSSGGFRQDMVSPAGILF